MKVINRIEISDDDRDHLANVFDGKVTRRLASREDINRLLSACLRVALNLPIGEFHFEKVDDAGKVIIEDINAGGWSFIGEPPGSNQ